jgi:hypothetical protein
MSITMPPVQIKTAVDDLYNSVVGSGNSTSTYYYSATSSSTNTNDARIDDYLDSEDDGSGYSAEPHYNTQPSNPLPSRIPFGQIHIQSDRGVEIQKKKKKKKACGEHCHNIDEIMSYQGLESVKQQLFSIKFHRRLRSARNKDEIRSTTSTALSFEETRALVKWPLVVCARSSYTRLESLAHAMP